MNDTDHQYAPAIPSFYDFTPRPPAVKSECIRAYITPTNGATFAPSSQITMELSCGTPGQMIDPSQTALSFRIFNGTVQTVQLDKSAACVLSQIDLFHGSRQLSSISEYNLLQQILTDFSCGCDDYKTSGSMRGVADYVPLAITTAANFTDAYYARLGASIAPGASLTVCVPLISILGSMSMRAWPISQAKENIRIVIKLSDVLNYGNWSATPVGTCAIDNCKMWVSYIRIDPNVERKMVMDLGGVISVPCVDFVQTSTSVAAGSNYVSMPIAVRAKSATAIFVAIRKTANLGALGVFNLDRFTGGDVVGYVSYRFRIGSTIIPSSYVTAGAESRMELMRALGMQLSESTARTCVSAADYLSTAFVIGVSLQCFPMTEAMGDGLLVDSTIILEMNLGTAQTSAIHLDAFVQMEKTFVFANGAITFDA
ncbi:hypothetical protein T492DRAFT_1136000 [Pavlovales sp. CCMP2436]|nr:hypothetical protein T492DRAFT_1136000 [Pavlovales sp. CCMP2436]